MAFLAFVYQIKENVAVGIYWKNSIDRRKQSLGSILYIFWLWKDTAAELYDECSELTRPLNNSIMRNSFVWICEVHCQFRSINPAPVDFKKCNLLDGGRLYVFQLWKIKNRFNSNETKVSPSMAFLPLPSLTNTHTWFS